jgi:hypothetical protein
MSRRAEQLLESKVTEIIEILNPDMGYDEFVKLENEVFDKIMNHEFADVLINKINAQAKNLAIMAIDLIGGLEVKDLKMEEY